MNKTVVDFSQLIADRAHSIDVSGIRRIFELGAKLKNPINLSIGQPDFPVPDSIKAAAIKAIETDQNGYTLTQGTASLRHAISKHLKTDIDWTVPSDDLGLLVTSGTCGGLFLAFLALLNPGDEVMIPDPYFVIYPSLATLCQAKTVYCDTYPDFRMTADRVEPLITDRTKLVLVNSPGNPSGAVLRNEELRDLVDLCEDRGIVLLADEIYDEFTFSDARENGRCPSPARMTQNMLLIRGFGKTYGCTGWRMGYAAGPIQLIQQMTKLQQYTFTCAPSIAQYGLAGAFLEDMSGHVQTYQRRRDLVVSAFSGMVEVVQPGGAFYVFVPVPQRLGISATQFVERAVEQNVLVIPGAVFSRRDTHFRISYAAPESTLAEGLRILQSLMN